MFILKAINTLTQAGNDLAKEHYLNRNPKFLKDLQAARRGDPRAQTEVGKAYDKDMVDNKGEIVFPGNPEKAVYWYNLAAQRGYGPAQYLIGEKYHYGKGVKEDKKQAAHWYKKAVQQGEEKAQIKMIDMYEDGILTPTMNQQTISWYHKAAVTHKNPRAYYTLGKMYENGEAGLEQDIEKAIHFYQIAAKGSDGRALFRIAEMYEYGLHGYPQDERKAVEIYQSLYLSPEALNKLGIMYELGRGGLRKDISQARLKYLMAAVGKNKHGAYNLGRMYEYGGVGVNKSYTEAARWYQRSIEYGYSSAKESLDRVNQLIKDGALPNGDIAPNKLEDNKNKDEALQNQDLIFEDLTDNGNRYQYNSIPYDIPYNSTAADINSEIKENVVEPHSYHSLLEDVLDTDEEAALDSDEEDSDDEEIFTNNTIPSSYGNISPDPGQSSNMPGVMPNPTPYNSHSQEKEKYESLALQNFSENFFNAWQDSDIKEDVSESNVSYNFHRLQNRHGKTSLAEFTNLNYRVEMLQQKFLAMEQALVDPLERKEDLDKLNKFRQGKLYYQHFRNMLHLPLLAHKVIATGLVTTPSSPLVKKIELALSLITPFIEIVRKLVEKSISAIEHEIGAASSKRIQIAASVSETENVIDYTARKIALAYQPLLEHIEEDAQVEALAEYAVGHLLDYIQEHSEAISKDDYINSEEIFPERACREEFLDHVSRALITHKPENEASLTTKTLLLQALEATNKIVEYTEPLKLLMRIYKSITKIKYITLSDNIKLSFEQAYTLGIHLNEIEHLYPPYYLRPKNAGMIKSLQNLGCATRAAFFKCDNLKTLEPHHWRLQLIPQSQNKGDGLPQANIQEVAKKVDKQAHQLQHVTTEIKDLKSKFSLFFNPEISHPVEIDNGAQVQLAAQVSQQKQQTSSAASSTAQFDKQELQDDRLQLQLLTYQVATITEELENAAKKKEAKYAKNTSPPESSVSSAVSETMLIKQQVQTDQQVVLISNQLMFITEQLNQLSTRMNQLEEENSRKTNHYRKYGT